MTRERPKLTKNFIEPPVRSYGDCIACDGYILDETEAPYCPTCARERRLADMEETR